MTDEEFWGRPMEPGPVKDDPLALLSQARVVKDALNLLFKESTVLEEAQALHDLIENARATTLARLARLLK